MKRLILGIIAVLVLSAIAFAEEKQPKVYTDSDIEGYKKSYKPMTSEGETKDKNTNKPTAETPSDSSAYIESLFARIDREIELGSPCKEINPFLERLNREYDSMNEKQRAKFNVINKVCQKETCLEQAEAKYKKAWIRECKDRREAENCSLHVEVAKALNDQLRYDKNACKE